MAAPDPESAAWLTAFARCVRERDYAGGRALVAADVVGFGAAVDVYLDERDIWSSGTSIVKNTYYFVDNGVQILTQVVFPARL